MTDQLSYGGPFGVITSLLSANLLHFKLAPLQTCATSNLHCLKPVLLETCVASTCDLRHFKPAPLHCFSLQTCFTSNLCHFKPAPFQTCVTSKLYRFKPAPLLLQICAAFKILALLSAAFLSLHSRLSLHAYHQLGLST